MASEEDTLLADSERNYGTEGVLMAAVPGGSSTRTPPPVAISYAPARRWPQYVAAISATLGAFALGTVLGWISPAVLRVRTDYALSVSNADIGWLGSLVFLGAAAAFAPISYLLNKFGRRVIMLSFLVPFTIGWLLIILARSLTLIYIGRFLTGVASGSYCITTPLYTAEIAQKEIRGALGCMFQIMITLGLLFAYIVGSFTTLITLSEICACVPLLFGILFYFQPESPVYLVRKNRTDEARSALKYLRGAHFDVDSEIQEIVASEVTTVTSESIFCPCLRSRASRHAMLVACGVMALQQLSGMYPIMAYSGIILQTTGTRFPAEIAIIILGVVQFLGNLTGEAVIDKKGRKYLLTRSLFYMAMCLLVLGLYFKFRWIYPFNSVLNSAAIPLLLLSGFAVAFSIGLGPVPWVFIGEVFPEAVKYKAAAMACIVNLLCSFLVTQFFVQMIYSLGKDVTFYLFAAVCALGILFVKFIVLETKGKTFQEIQTEMNSS